MRITGGEFGGRRLKVPPGEKVRPTQDRVREALFSMLMNDVAGAFFVDLFAGCGSVGLEALSRGAGRVLWVEQDRRHAEVIRCNRDMVAADLGEIVCAGVERWIAGAGRGAAADIVFADPPYGDSRENGFRELMRALADNAVIREGGLFVAEMPVSADAEDLEGWELVRDREYGQTRLAVYRREVERVQSKAL